VPAAAIAPPATGARAIPLSEVSAPAAAAASIVPAATATLEEERLPSFASDEIEELVDEVEETPVETEAPPEAPVVAEEEPVELPEFEVDGGDLPAADSFEVAAAASPSPSGQAARPVTAAPPEVEASPRFEVDHQLDPDWTPPAGAGARGGIVAPSAGEEFAHPPVPSPPPAPEEPASGRKVRAADEERPWSQGARSADDAEAGGIGRAALDEAGPALAAAPAAETEEQVWELGGDQPLEDYGEPADDPAVLDALERGPEEDAVQFEPLEDATFGEPLATEFDEPAERSAAGAPPQTEWPQPSADEPGADAEITLTDALEDRAFFEDAGLDVARLGGGTSREIVVPVEVESGEGAVRRYKLSIRLRLDPVD